MAVVSTNDLKRGMSLDLPDGLFQVVDFQHVKPGKGGAFVRTTLKNLRNGAHDRPDLPRRREGRAGRHRQAGHAVPLQGRQRLRLHGQRELRPAPRAARRRSPTPPTTSSTAPPSRCRCTATRSSAPTCPAAVELNVAETEPGVQGDRVSGARKPATLETGLVLQVPLFVNPGDRIKVDTRSGEYITRA